MATTFIISFRSSTHGSASVEEGRGFQCDGTDPSSVIHVPLQQMAQACAGRRILFATHGFNVSWESGLKSLARLHDDLSQPGAPFPLTGNDVFVGVLWPGDWRIPIVNYPWEAFDAVKSGELLARAINQHFGSAQSISFVSHSLGARVVLSAAEFVARPVDQVILTAAAADNNCLVRQHAPAHSNARQVHVLSSKRDNTLKFAYPAGDFLSDVFGDDDSPFAGALGYRGPKPPTLDRMIHVWVPGKPRNVKNNPAMGSDYDHGDYYPSPQTPRPAHPRKTSTVSDYISAAFAGQRRWP